MGSTIGLFVLGSSTNSSFRFYFFGLFHFLMNLVTKQWVAFLLISIGIAVFLYVSRQRRRNTESIGSAIRHDHVQGGSKGASRPSPKKRD